MGLNFTNKSINTNKIDSNGILQVSLEISASPEILKKSLEIVLLLDISESTSYKLKDFAKKTISIIEKIAFFNKIGLVTFSDDAKIESNLTENINELKSIIDNISFAGKTNHSKAFKKALQVFDFNSFNKKMIIIITDGKITKGINTESIINLLQNLDIFIYVIGIEGKNGIDKENLINWTNKPYLPYIENESEFKDLKKILEKMTKKPGATNITINDIISADFFITKIFPVSKGVIEKINDRNIKWKIDELGAIEKEEAYLNFLVKYIGNKSNIKNISEHIFYEDSEGNKANFQNPIVEIDCGIDISTEFFYKENEIIANRCSGDYLQYDLGDIYINSTGKILQINLKLKSILPKKRVALAIILTEKDTLGLEHERGRKIMTIPAHNECSFKDININKILFILPDDISVSPIIEKRVFNVKAIANYIDD